jgi:hypothetical protein
LPQAFVPKKFSLMALLLALLAAGCASSSHRQSFSRPFVFGQDTFAYANELVWEYDFDDATGKTSHHTRVPPPQYTHHCFVVARAAKQFFQNARFDPAQPRADEKTYRDLIRHVLSVSPRQALSDDRRTIIPGYTNLSAFSRDWEHLLKQEAGGAWQSYFQRGHWRMIFPLSRAHQNRMARQLLDSVRRNRPVVVHVVRFPSLAINHSIIVYDARESAEQITFEVYDPNDPTRPSSLVFNGANGRFTLPRNGYFTGGRVDAYEIYHAWNY